LSNWFTKPRLRIDKESHKSTCILFTCFRKCLSSRDYFAERNCAQRGMKTYRGNRKRRDRDRMLWLCRGND
jgi:hypothetical protein